MKNTGKLGARGGFTLLETLLSLSIAAAAAVFFGGFLIPQMRFYYNHDRISQARDMCGQAYVRLEEILRYGYMYGYDPGKPESVFCYTREEGPGSREEGRTRIPAMDTWPSFSAGDLEVESLGGMSLNLDFDGTTERKAEVKIQAVKDDVVIYEQEAVITSLYRYEMREGRNP